MTNCKHRWDCHRVLQVRKIGLYRTDSRSCSKINCPPRRIPRQLSEKAGSVEFSPRRVQRGEKSSQRRKADPAGFYGLRPIPSPALGAIREASSIWGPDVLSRSPSGQRLAWSSLELRAGHERKESCPSQGSGRAAPGHSLLSRLEP